VINNQYKFVLKKA